MKEPIDHRPEQPRSVFQRVWAGRAGRLLDRLAEASAFVACLLLVFQVAAICLDVLLRLAIDRPITGVIALTEWSLLYVAFLGAAWLQRENGHVRVDIFRSVFPQAISRGIEIGTILMGLAVTGALVWFGTQVTWIKLVEFERDFFKLPWMPLYPIYAVIPFGALLWFLMLLRSLSVPPEGGSGAPDI